MPNYFQCLRLKWRRKPVRVGESGPMRLTGHQLSELTMNFSRSRVIAYGGFSTVYLGTKFPGSVHPVAIKTVDCRSSNRMCSIFNQELQILQRVQHDRIVGVLGYSDEGGVGALVLPYVPNGTLCENLSNSVLPLPWKNRVGIAYQLAEALEYLHEKCDPHIVHGDVKSSNVLLDTQFNCKLCDFGSATTGFSSDLVMSRRKMIGSPGYTDPHYLRTGIATKKSDMYSFGVVLLELITGSEAISSSKSSRVWEDESEVAKMVDPRLLAEGEYDLEETMAVASIAASCLVDSPTLRPSATDVLKILKNRVPAVGFLFSVGKGA